jgi:hypothetical protein
MTDETVTNRNALKPVPCGCGGEAKIGHIEKTSYLPKDRWYIGCPKCDICTGIHDTESEAITAWNRAMGERTAKVKDAARDVNGCRWGKCAECGSLVFSHYCPVCGARLEWDE